MVPLRRGTTENGDGYTLTEYPTLNLHSPRRLAIELSLIPNLQSGQDHVSGITRQSGKRGCDIDLQAVLLCS